MSENTNMSIDDQIDELLEQNMDYMNPENSGDINDESYDGYDDSEDNSRSRIKLMIGLGIIAVIFIVSAFVLSINSKQPKEEQKNKTTTEISDTEILQDGVANVGKIETNKNKDTEEKAEDENEDNKSFITPSEKTEKDENIYKFPEYDKDAQLVKMDMSSLEIYNKTVDKDYITLYVGDVNGNRAYINIDKSKYPCNEELGKLLGNDDNNELNKRLNSYLNINSKDEDYKKLEARYIDKYSELAVKKGYTLTGYASDYKHSSNKENSNIITGNKKSISSDNKNQNNTSNNFKQSNSNKKNSSSTGNSKGQNNTINNNEGSYTSTSKQSTYVTVTYVLNGGINSSYNKEKVYVGDFNVFVFAKPQREGYNFDGWYTDSTFKNSIKQISNTSGSQITIYAKWTHKLSSLTCENSTIELDLSKKYNIKNFIITDPVDFSEKLSYTSNNEKVITITDTGDINIIGYGKCNVKIKSENGLSTQITFIINHTHNWEVINHLSSTCEREGYIEYKCFDCDNTRIEKTAKLNHDYSLLIVDKEPSCNEYGIQSYHCSMCNKPGITQKIPMIEHDYIKNIIKSTSCDEDDIENYTCRICGMSYNISIPAVGHDYKEISNVNGKKTFKCTKCNRSYISSI